MADQCHILHSSRFALGALLLTPLNPGVAEAAGLPAEAVAEVGEDAAGGLQLGALLARLQISAGLALHEEQVHDRHLLPLLGIHLRPVNQSIS